MAEWIRVLAADDEGAILRLLLCLPGTDVEVVDCPNVEEAITALAHADCCAFAAILSDAHMVGDDGAADPATMGHVALVPSGATTPPMATALEGAASRVFASPFNLSAIEDFVRSARSRAGALGP